MKWDDKTRWNWTKLDIVAGVFFLIIILSFPVGGLLMHFKLLKISIEGNLFKFYLIVTGILYILIFVYVVIRNQDESSGKDK